jgi:hypothetical protein
MDQRHRVPRFPRLDWTRSWSTNGGDQLSRRFPEDQPMDELSGFRGPPAGPLSARSLAPR